MMHTEMGDRDKAEDAEVDSDEELTEETVVLTETGVTDNVGDVSVETVCLRKRRNECAKAQ